MTATTEYNYLLSEAKHVDGTNRYTFEFPQYWRQSIYSGLRVGVRSIKMIPAPVYFKLTGINICSMSGSLIDFKPIDIVMIISPSDHLDDLNLRFKDAITRALSSYTFISPDDVALEYYDNVLHLFIDREDPDIWFDIEDIDGNDATKQMLHFDTVDDIPESNLRYVTEEGPQQPGGKPNKRLVEVMFRNIWDRDELYILSSLTDMSYNRYLGYTNNDFHPPKQYNIHNTDTTFWIELYDKTNSIPIELPPRSVLVIEMILQQRDSL